MTTLLAVFWAAFEFVAADPAAAGLAASAAGGSWRSGFVGNPALLCSDTGWAASGTFTRPYGLLGLYSGRLDAMARPKGGRLGLGCSFATSSLDKYQEHDMSLVTAFDVLPDVAAGVCIHGMAQVWAGEVLDLLAAVDAGAVARLGSLRLALVGRRLNIPKLHDESELPLVLEAGGSWQPVRDLVLALDLCREGTEESAALGVEFRLMPQLRLRAGLVTTPLRYSGGFGVNIGPLGIDYAWQFHPQLKETHVVGAEVKWH